MISFIHSTTILVADQERALRFYVDTLGWEKRIDATMPDGYRFLTVAPPGGQAELVLGAADVLGGAPGQGIVTRGRGMEGASGITFAVDDVDGTYRALTERGVQFAGEPQDMPWGDRATWMMDPDGNRFFFTGR
ncbi:MAG TPA: VOC family protein [Longimicrobium sp.]|nr:VOC family protein [Longimicrobium sp.]